MSDAQPSRRLINLTHPNEARAWKRHFGVSLEALSTAVAKVGPSAVAVRKELADQEIRANLNQLKQDG